MEPSSNNVFIRSAIESDVAAFRELRLEALRNHPESFGADYERDAAAPETHWRERLTGGIDSPTGIIHFAVSDQRLVGMAGVYRKASPKEQHYATIWGVYVRPDWRGLRIAEAMIAACVAWAQTEKLRLVKIAAVATNAAAIRCYLRCGFTVYGVDPEGIHYNGIYYDELLMARRL
jgi:RimJ/RimL family protein N-acetyltransferase